MDPRPLFLASAFEHSSDGILITDLDGKILDVNPAFVQLYGYHREEAVGKKTNILRSRCSTDAFYQAMWRSINDRGEWKGEITDRAKDGSEIPIWLSITPVIREGKRIGYMGIEIDMRAKKELERRALEAERLAAVGRMSSQVAHEIRNPLSSISLNVELLKEELDSLRKPNPGSAVKEAESLLKAIQKEVDRLAEIAGDYLRFSRLPQPKKETVNLNDHFETVINFFREEGRRRSIDILFRKCEKITYLAIDPKQMEQALLNLVKNAFDAMPSGGTVEVGILEENGAVVAFVRDEGFGMDELTRRRIFDPFFTTKEAGTGLGLALVRQVAAEHGGTVWCESIPEKGTTFFIRLPVPKESVKEK